MGNPFNSLNPNAQFNANQMAGFRNMYQLLTQSSNPVQTFRQLAMNNPNLQPIVNMLNQGANPQQIFNNMCQQRGINPQEFLRNLTGK